MRAQSNGSAFSFSACMHVLYKQDRYGYRVHGFNGTTGGVPGGT